jgi:regulator of protease activity HflC (stomatin/prohibitin superfamily)
MKKFLIGLTLVASTLLSGCLTRIETGEVGVRVDASKQIQGTELQPGSWNQTLVGHVLTFPIKDLTIKINDKNPMTADNSPLKDFDLTVVYSINPNSVAELYSTKSKSFHARDDGDTLLMYDYMTNLVTNVSYKVVRNYKSLEVADNRQKMETEILSEVNEQLAKEKLNTALTLTVVQVRSVVPNDQILASATEFVRSQNELKIKENEVKLAKLESERMAALASNSGQSIAYMNAQAMAAIAEGVKNGKVQTIVVPYDFKGIVNAGK